MRKGVIDVKESSGKKMLPPYVMLMLVAIVMSFAIAEVYSLTKDTIEAAALEAQAAARNAVMESAASMEELPLAEGVPVDYAYEAYDAAGNVVGYVSQITVVGFGGEIEVTVGMDLSGSITAISVGGSNFSETSGLGAKTREPAFTDQFKGKSGMLVLKRDIDSVTGASVSSGAVVSGVNKAVDYMKSLLPEDASAAVEELALTEAQIQTVLPGAQSVTWMGGGSGIDGWWQADNGYIVRATGFGEGPIAVTIGFDPSGTVTGIIIGDELFMETEGRGDRVLEEWYGAQFIGRSGVQAYGDGLDAISGATVTSDATLSAINACMGFDPAAPGTAAPAAERAADAVTEASIPEEETVAPDPNPPVSTLTPDAETEASIPEEETISVPTPAPTADAATEASIPEEETVPAAATPAAMPVSIPTPAADAVTEASIPEEETVPAVVTAAPTPIPARSPAIRVTFVPLPARAETPDAVTEASIPEEEAAPAAATPAPTSVPAPTPVPTPTPDAVTEASIPEEETAPAAATPAPTPTPAPDAVTEASITE